MSSRPHKFKDGGDFLNVVDAVNWIAAGGWVYWYGAPKSPKWMMNVALIVIRGGVSFGRMRRAVRVRP